MTKKRFKCVNVEETSFDYLSFVADRLDMKKSVFLKRLLGEVFEIFSDLKKGSANVFFDTNGNQLLITAFGDSIIELGVRPAENLAEENKAEPVIVRLPSKKTTKSDGVLKDE